MYCLKEGSLITLILVKVLPVTEGEFRNNSSQTGVEYTHEMTTLKYRVPLGLSYNFFERVFPSQLGSYTIFCSKVRRLEGNRFTRMY